MAVKGLSAKQKADLAEIVSCETLLDIEEYIRPQFPPKFASKELLASDLNLTSRRRIVQDGHGRWREVKPQYYSSNLQPLLRKTSDAVKRKSRLDIKDGVGETTGTYNMHSNNPSFYNNLSMALRSNVFPGLGNNQWHSTTGKVFKKQEIIPPSQREKFFGIQSDEFGKWSAANVHHERMKKTWDTYLDSLPKQAANWSLQDPKEITTKVEKTPPQTKVKKPNPKPKAQKKQTPAAEENVTPDASLPSKPPIDIPADDNDDDFWDFYDTPFNKLK